MSGVLLPRERALVIDQRRGLWAWQGRLDRVNLACLDAMSISRSKTDAKACSWMALLAACLLAHPKPRQQRVALCFCPSLSHTHPPLTQPTTTHTPHSQTTGRRQP